MNPIENDHEIESLEAQFPAAAGLAVSNAREWGRIESSLGEEQGSACSQTGGL